MNVNLTIDGVPVTVPKGTWLVEAAKSVKQEIPVYCYHTKLGPAGLCRVCLVEIEGILLKIVERRKLKHKNIALQTRVQAVEGPNRLIGDSPAMQTVQRLIATIAPTDATVLIQGETGTGKDVVARTIYQLSKRVDMPFVPVNCGALSENLVESELFGHRKGAFTGAERDHKGLFEVANGGTLFLDEVGELNKNIQVKLLRFLE